jgi:predicted Zn-dependent protease
VSEALELAGRLLSAAEGDEALALVHRERSGLARFARSEVHQPTLIENDVLELQIVRDGRLGVAVSNRIDDDGMRALVARASEAADSAPADPDFPGLAPPTDPPEVAGFDEETAALSAEDQARLAAAAIDASKLDLYGFFTSGVTELALASSTGVAVSQPMTDAAVLALAAVDGASGYAEQTSWRLGGIDPAGASDAAVEKAEQTRGAVSLEPGSYRAVLEPPAFAELLQYFAFDAFGALGLLEERSYAHGRSARRSSTSASRLPTTRSIRGGYPRPSTSREPRSSGWSSSATASSPMSSGTGTAARRPARRAPATRRRARCATGGRFHSRSRSPAATRTPGELAGPSATGSTSRASTT